MEKLIPGGVQLGYRSSRKAKLGKLINHPTSAQTTMHSPANSLVIKHKHFFAYCVTMVLFCKALTFCAHAHHLGNKLIYWRERGSNSHYHLLSFKKTWSSYFAYNIPLSRHKLRMRSPLLFNSTMKLFLLLLVFTLVQEALSTYQETCECHQITELVNTTVQEAIAGLENRISHLIRSTIKRSESHDLDKVETTPPPLKNSEDYPAISCKDLHEKYPFALSGGYYWISQSRGPAVRVYCSMSETCGGERGGWMRVANVDMRNQSCPTGLALVSSPKRSCKPILDHRCVSNIFSTQEVQYSRVCGKIIGYQERRPVAFHNYNYVIDSYYVNGHMVETHANTSGLSQQHHMKLQLQTVCITVHV